MAATRIEDVARAAGVSIKTVSRVINHESNVRDSTREHVQRVIAEMGYRPDPYARSLAGQRSFLLALLHGAASPSYLMDAQRGMLAACAQHHYGMMLCPLDLAADATARDGVASLAARLQDALGRARPDGLLLLPPLTDHAGLQHVLADSGYRYACLSPWLERPAGMAEAGARMDDTAAVRELVRHLIALGHRDIGYIDGPTDHGASHWRRAGVVTALAEIGRCLPPDHVAQAGFDFDSALPAAMQLLRCQPRPTAILAANDDMAAAVLRVAWELGLAVPGDLSVCGFDDSPLSRQLSPPLTTIRQPTEAMATRATLELLDMIGGRSAGHMHTLPYRLMLRATVGPPAVSP